jgi:hypothetical protein
MTALPYFDYFRWDSKVDQLPSSLRKLLGVRNYQTLQAIAGWLKHERSARLEIPLRRRLAVWRKGFYAESATLYDLPTNNPDWYLTDYQHLTMGLRINAWEGLYNHKLGLRAFLLAKGLRQPETLAYLYEGHILVHPFSSEAWLVTPGEFVDLLRQEGEGAEWIVKPEDGLRGEGLFMLLVRQDEFWVQRGREVQRFDLEQFLLDQQHRARGNSGAMLIERKLTQGAFWRSLFPDTVNTLRVQTLWTPGDAAPFVARAVQRIGTADTVPTDNWSGGGICAPVDLQSGRLGEGRVHPLKAPPERRGRRFTVHPDTGSIITGTVVPGWERIVGVILEAAASIPFNRMGGWDVLVDADQVPVILEANGNSDVNLLQVHGGLLAEPRIRHFYRTVGVL